MSPNKEQPQQERKNPLFAFTSPPAAKPMTPAETQQAFTPEPVKEERVVSPTTEQLVPRQVPVAGQETISLQVPPGQQLVPPPQQQQLIPPPPVVTSFPQERLPSPYPPLSEPLFPPAAPQQLPLLWCTPPTVEYLNCTFDQQHEKVTWYVSTRYIGALRSVSKLVYGNNKMTETVNEMIEDFLRKYADLLEAREDVVRNAEMHVRKKKKIFM